MRCVDVTVLVSAHRADLPEHVAYRALLERLATAAPAPSAGPATRRQVKHRLTRHAPRRTVDVHWPYKVGGVGVTVKAPRRRNRRLELRTTAEERELIERAVAVTETDLTEFVVGQATAAARRVLADRTEFVLSAEAAAAWEAVNSRPAADLPGLRDLMRRPSPFE